MNPHSSTFYTDIRQSSSCYYDEKPSKQIRSMPVGNERLAALRDLGVTFKEGTHRVTKIATPSGTPVLPSFVDAGQIEHLLIQEQQKQKKRKDSYDDDAIGNCSVKEDFGRYADWR
ncbi:hypothetical protein BCV72DRAFT_108541 [Rhizopus microsporus var. microsporus]|uniref:Uncharacterized protein n=1 Tax=Rhizopus microsporus var. microsporus TaxID=86635 RepID=A0A1X0R5Z2_RHIZD|nr:hypothetical protein BCV72DRAFT_108541 [Rhizopus microsporus var. microsporus]